ncbi:hypothetical protein LTR70_003674 [Exophiala xenobiotica]|nr:hypothetical protein LTR70_003674 [Exophiala xenobiotica]
MSSDDITQNYLNGHSGVILAVFIIVSAFVIWPIYIPLPPAVQRPYLRLLLLCRVVSRHDYERLSVRALQISISLETAPVIGVIIALATTTIDGTTIRLGIEGDGNVKPYDVLVLFISLAYISIALDGTGAIEAVAFWVSKRGGSSGMRLFTYLYVFLLAWVFSEFMAANTASAVLVSSNPTNVLIAGSFNFNYLTGFTKWTVLPSIVPALLNYPILLSMFWNKIPKTIIPLQDNPWSKVRDPAGAVFFSVLMVVTVAVLVGTSFVRGALVEVWMVTAPAGILAFAFDFGSDWWHYKHRRAVKEQAVSDKAADMRAMARIGSDASKTDGQTNAALVQNKSQFGSPGQTSATDSSTSSPALRDKDIPASVNPETTTLFSLLRSFRRRFPGTTLTVTRLPIPLLPFAICEFILVRGLARRGWITVFAQGFSKACTTPLATVFFFGFVSAAFLCPLAGTNIGATIILVEILRDSAFAGAETTSADPKIMSAAVYATAMGSNLGAFSYTFAGSLAGLLWKGLLADKDIHVSQLKFAMVNMLPLLVQTTVACAIIYGQLYWFE